MIALVSLFVHILIAPFRTQARLAAEIVMLRHQLNVLRRRMPSRPRLTVADRLIFIWLYRLMPSLLTTAIVVQPDTIVRWHRAGFRLYWRWKSRLSRRPAQGSDRASQPDRADEPGESAVGRSAHPW